MCATVTVLYVPRSLSSRHTPWQVLSVQFDGSRLPLGSPVLVSDVQGLSYSHSLEATRSPSLLLTLTRTLALNLTQTHTRTLTLTHSFTLALCYTLTLFALNKPRP